MAGVEDVFLFYQDYVKPLYCEIEARNNSLPVELLFEIHAAFDHLKRIYADHEEIGSACNRAISHLKRGSLDAFKLKLKYFHEDLKILQDQRIDFSLIDNGRFLPNLLSDKDKIIRLGIAARMSESKTEPDEAFDLWSQTSATMDDFYDKYLNEASKFEWARRKTFLWVTKDSWRAAIIGFVTGCLSSYLIWLLVTK